MLSNIATIFRWMAYILIAVLLVLIAFFGARVFFALNTSEIENDIGDKVISEDMQETVDEYRSSFWVEDDDLKTYNILKTKAKEVYTRNSQKRNITQIELNDEMLVMTNYAAAARNVYPEEGLRVFAQIYNDERYSGKIRANALLHVMFYPVEKLGTEDLSIQNANDWIFSDELLGSVLQGTEYEGVYLENQKMIFEASAIGLTQAAFVSDSGSLSAKIVSLKYDVQLNLLVDDLLASKGEDIWSRLGEESWSGAELAPIESMLDDYQVLQDQIIKGFNSVVEYEDEYSHAAKNVLRSYTTMRALGINTDKRISDMHDATSRYATKYLLRASPEMAQKINAYAGVNALYMTCNYIMQNGYDINDPTRVNAAVALAEPFLSLSYSDQRIFLVTAALGQRKSGACYQPFVVLGQKSEEFKNALIQGVGGWEESQFE